MHSGGDYEYIKDKHGLALAAMEGMHYREYELQMNPGGHFNDPEGRLRRAIGQTLNMINK